MIVAGFRRIYDFFAARPYISAGIGLAIQIAVVFSPALVGGRTVLPTDFFIQAHLPFVDEKAPFHPWNHFEGDVLDFYVPYKMAAKEHLYRPYWNPYNFGGIPQYANTYAAHFSTLQWMLKFGSVEKIVPIQLMGFLWIAGMGMFFLLRTFGIGSGSAYFFASAYSLNGLFITLLLRGWIPGAFAWVPAWIGNSRKLTEKFSWRSFALASMFLGFTFLDGFFQSSAFAAVLLGIFFLTHAAVKEKPFRGWAKWIGMAAGVFALAFALSAVSWLPTLEYLREDLAKGASRMAGGDFEKSWYQRALSLLFLPGLFLPEALGSVRTLDLTKLIKTHLQDFSAYLGMAPAVFGLAAFFSRDLRRNFELRPFFIFAVIGVVLPAFTPLDRFLYFRFLVVYVFGISVIGAFVADRWIRNDPSAVFALARSMRIFRAIFAAWMLAWLSVAITLWIRGDWLRELIRRGVAARVGQSMYGVRFPEWMAARSDLFLDRFTFSSPIFWLPLLGFAILFFTLHGRRCVRFRLAILSALTFLQLAVFAWGWMPFNRPEEFPFYPKNEVVDFLSREGRNGRFLVFGADSARRTILPFNMASAYQIFDFGGFDGLKPYTAFQLMSSLSSAPQLGVRYFVTYRDIEMDPALFKLRYEGRVRIYEALSVAPIAQIRTQYRVLGSRGEAVKWTQENGLGAAEIALEQGLDFPSHENAEPMEARLLDASDNESHYAVESKGPALFVLSETWYPGWKVFIDGTETKIIRVAGALRGVALPGGGHAVDFRFDPESYRIGRAISMSALVFLGFLFFLRRSTERKHS